MTVFLPALEAGVLAAALPAQEPAADPNAQKALLAPFVALDPAAVQLPEFTSLAERYAAAAPAAGAVRAAVAVLRAKVEWQEVTPSLLAPVAAAVQQDRLGGIAWLLPAVLCLQIAVPADPRWHHAEFEAFAVDSPVRDPERAQAALGRFAERLARLDPLAPQWRTTLEYFGEAPGERTLDETIAAFALHRRFVAALVAGGAPVRQLSATDVRVLLLQQSHCVARRRGDRAQSLTALAGWTALQPAHPVAALLRGLAFGSGAETRDVAAAHRDLDRFLALTKAPPAAGAQDPVLSTPELLAIVAVLDGPATASLAELRTWVEAARKQKEPLLYCADRKWLERQVVALERALRTQVDDLRAAERNEQDCAFRVTRREQEVAGLRGGNALKLNDAQNRLIGERDELKKAQKGLVKARQDEAAARARWQAHQDRLDGLEK